MIKKKSNKDVPSVARYIKKRLEQTNLVVESERKYQDMLLQERKRMDVGKTIEIEPSTKLLSLLENRQIEKEKAFAKIHKGPAAPIKSAILQSYSNMLDHIVLPQIDPPEGYSNFILDASYYLDLLEGTGYSGA